MDALPVPLMRGFRLPWDETFRANGTAGRIGRRRIPPATPCGHPVRAWFSSKADAPEKPKSGSGVGANLEMVESGILASPFVLDGPYDLFHQSPQAWLLLRASGYEEDLPDGHPAPIAVL